MKAVLTTAHGGPEVLQLRHDYPAPTPGPGELLVRIAATAVNFHDIFTRRGMPGVRIKLPVIVEFRISRGRSRRSGRQWTPSGSASGY